MALLSIFRGTQAECSARPVSDGTLLFATDTKKIYLDKDSSRIEMSSVDDLGDYVTKEQLTTALNGKANTTHTHTQDQVTGLKDALAGKASTSHSHSVASSSASGFMSAADKQKLDGIAAGANKYTLPVASSTALGGMKIGYKESGKNYSVKLDDNNQAYVTVPWTDTTSKDTNTTYTLTKSGSTITLEGSDGSSTAVNDDNTTYSLGSFGITATAAELNYVDGVTSNVQTQLNGKAASSHDHSAANITSGTLSADRIPTITDGKIQSVSASKITGTIPQSILPSYVDDVLEYENLAAFPKTGESGKIYVADDTNKTYRWSGTAYVEISASLALGTTSSTAFRGDYGNTAYAHAQAKGSAFSSGLYKITTNSQGHVTAATAVTKSDITALGIPGSDTNTNTTYSLSKSGSTITLKGSDGSTTSVTDADTNTTYSTFKGATTSAAGGTGLVPAPTAGASNRYLRSDGTWSVPPDNNTNTTYSLSKDGSTITLTGSDGSKTSVTDSNTTYSLSSFGVNASAAELNYVKGVTSSIQTQLNSKAASSHNHSAANITSGTLSIDRLPTVPVSKGGTGATDAAQARANIGAAAANHTHSKITYKGKHTEIASGTTANSPQSGVADGQGLYLTSTYNDSATPANYGNIINAIGDGTGQLLLEWSGSDNTTGRMWYRSHRDTATGGWGAWKEIAYIDDIPKSLPASDVSSWAKAATKPSYSWNEITGKPTTFAPSSHTHTKSQITDFPSSLKNPNSLTISLNGTSQGAYDGSSTKSINVTPASIGAATSGHTHNYAGADSAGGAAKEVKNWGNASENVARHVWFSNNGADNQRVYNDNFKYNPVGNTVSCNISGTANVANYLNGTVQYVTKNSVDKPYWRCLKLESATDWYDSSVILCVDAGYENGGFGILAVRFRNDSVSGSAGATHGTVQWLCRYGYEPDQFILKIHSAKATTGYADLYFHATGTYNACNIRILANTTRGSNGSSWQLINDEPRAAMDTRAYTAQATGYDVGKVAYASKLATARTISLAGDVTGSANFDGSANISITSNIAAGTVGTNELASNAVTNAKIAADSVSLAKLGSDVGTVAVQSAQPSDTNVKLWIQI